MRSPSANTMEGDASDELVIGRGTPAFRHCVTPHFRTRLSDSRQSQESTTCLSLAVMPLESLRIPSPSSIIDGLLLIHRCRPLQSPLGRCISSANSPANQYSVRGIPSPRNRKMAPPPPLQKQYMSSKPNPKKASSAPRPSSRWMILFLAEQELL